MNLNPICHSSPAKKWNAHFLIMFNFWWSAGLVNGLKPHPPPFSSQNSEMLIFLLHSTCDVGQTGQWTWTSSTTPLQPKNEMLIFGLHSTFDDWPGWSMDLNPIHHPSPAKKMKSSFLYYVEVLVISRAGWWTRTPSATPLQPKKWNAHFWILFKFWWLAGLVDGLEPHPPPLCTQKNEMVILDYVQLQMISQAALWTQTHLPPLSCQKMKCLFLDYVQLLMISWAARWTWTRSTPHLQPENWNAHILIMFNFWW